MLGTTGEVIGTRRCGFARAFHVGNGAALIEVACCELGCAVAISKGVAGVGSPMHVEFQLLMHTGISAEVVRYMYEYNLWISYFRLSWLSG